MIFFQILLNGLALGSLYACIAAGFSLVWGVLNIINLMHGSFIVLGAYLALGLYVAAGIPPWWSVGIAVVLFFCIGYVVQRFVINRVVGKPVLLTLTLTFGLDLVIQNAMLYFFKADYRALKLDPALGSLAVGQVVVPVDRLIAMIAALLLTLALYLVLRKSRIGRAIVAVRVDQGAARLLGVNIPSIYAVAFGIGAAMAAAAGTLVALTFPFSPVASYAFLGKAFVVCVLGGLGSVPGVVLGGLLLGMVEAFGSYTFGPEYAVMLSFGLLVAFLVLRPQGIVGRWGFE